MDNPPRPKLAAYFEVAAAGHASSGWIHVNHSFTRAFDLHNVIGTA
jgi:hypothetical protein